MRRAGSAGRFTGPEAKAFVAAARQSDPKLVRDVEEMLARFAPASR